MNLTITLSPKAEQALRERAALNGRDMTELARELLEHCVVAPTLDEVLAPFRREVAESGMTDKELDVLFEEARDEAWHQRRGS